MNETKEPHPAWVWLFSLRIIVAALLITGLGAINKFKKAANLIFAAFYFIDGVLHDKRFLAKAHSQVWVKLMADLSKIN